MKILFVNHNTAEIYDTKRQAVDALVAGDIIDLYVWSEKIGEYTYRTHWEPGDWRR